MKIEYPAPEEQRAAVQSIIKSGVPRRRSVVGDFMEMYRGLGFRIIFHDMADVIFLAFLGAASVFRLILGRFASGYSNRGAVYTVLFTASPVLYFLLCLLAFWKERMSGTFEVKMSCKFTVYHLTAFRMMMFSCACISFNLAFVWLSCAAGIFPNFWQTFLVTASSLFLFSVLFLFSLLFSGRPAAPAGAAGLWLAGNLLLHAFFPAGYERVLRWVPLYLHLAVIAVLAVLYLAGLKRLISRQKERVLC